MKNSSFEALGLDTRIVRTLAERGYTEPTPIQAALIPALLEGKDAIGKAPTGTGKTAAFSLPAIQRLIPNAGHVQTLVLAPTRELAIQVADTMHEYGNASGVRVLPVYGGQAYGRQISRLRKGIDVVVATPGRLIDLAEKRAVDLGSVSTVILDEADEMLSMGFQEDIETILNLTPSDRQTVLMSATMPSTTRRLAKKYLKDPVSCSVEAAKAAPTIRERAYLVNGRDKIKALARILEVEESTGVLIFGRTRAGTDEIAAKLSARSIAAESLHGGMTQEVRSRIVERLRRGEIRVLVGTDVAARGLDIDDITHVFNFDLPRDPEVYVHRIGRTGRAGRGGDAVTLYAPNETGKLRRVEKFTGRVMEKPQLPTAEEIEAKRTAALEERLDVWVSRGRCHEERALVEKMVEAGGDPLEIAAAALRLARRAEFDVAVEKISVPDTRRPRKHERPGGQKRPTRRPFERREGMVQIALSAGRREGIQVNHVVAAMAQDGGLPSEAIGRVWIHDDHTLVDVHQSKVQGVLDKSGTIRFRKHRLAVRLA